MSDAINKPTQKEIDRILKLLRMSKDVSSPEEAAIAAQRARSLMDKWQLQESELNPSRPINEDMLEKPFGAKHDGNIYVWESYLATMVAEYNDCHSRIRNLRTVFLGYASDVEVAGHMYVYLTRAIWRLSDEFVARERRRGNTDRFLGDAHRHGATANIIQRLRAEIKNRDTKMSDGRDLVVIKRDAVAEHFGEIRYKTEEHLTPHQQYARSQGFQDANKISLHKQVKAATKPESKKLG